MLPGGTSRPSVKTNQREPSINSQKGKPNIKEGTGGRRQAEGGYIYRGLASIEREGGSIGID